MSRIRFGVVLIAAAFTAILPAIPAHAAAFTQQCDQSGGCLNVWGQGTLIKSYYGTTGNNNIAVQWIPGGYFQLRNNVYGGCLGDANGVAGDARAGANDTCNSTSTGTGGSYGTRFRPSYQCPSGWAAYQNVRWGGYIYIPPGNGQQIYLNSSVDCLRQES